MARAERVLWMALFLISRTDHLVTEVARTTISIVLLCTLAAASCSDSSTGPDSAPLVFQGTVAYQGSEWHRLIVAETGGVRVELDRVTARLIDVSSGLETDGLAIGFGLGQPEEEDCITTYQVSIVEGDVLAFGLGRDEYCLLMYDAGLLPEDAIVDYTLVVTQ